MVSKNVHRAASDLLEFLRNNVGRKRANVALICNGEEMADALAKRLATLQRALESEAAAATVAADIEHDRPLSPEVKASIQRSYEWAKDRMAFDFRIAKLQLGLPPARVFNEGAYIILPRAYECPDCRGEVAVDIYEWETVSGCVTRHGFVLYCHNEFCRFCDEMEGDKPTRNVAHCMPSRPAWEALYGRAYRFLLRRVRVRS